MSVFRDADHLYECIGELMNRAKKDPQVGPKIAKSKIVLQFRYTEPEAMLTVNGKDKPTQSDAYVDIIQGPCDLKPDIILSSTADVAHAFWQGKINLMAALAKKDVVAQGPVPKILKLLPAVKSLFAVYPTILREKGYGDLVLK